MVGMTKDSGFVGSFGVIEDGGVSSATVRSLRSPGAGRGDLALRHFL